jgi:hypothetical protein
MAVKTAPMVTTIAGASQERSAEVERRLTANGVTLFPWLAQALAISPCPVALEPNAFLLKIP